MTTLPSEILNYILIRQIGEGGMGRVFLAKNKSIHQFVAIKMLHPRFSNNPLLRERFRQEAIMLSSLDHPNIVKFLNYVENDQGIFLIMEYVDGMTLEDYITKKNGLIVESRAFPLMYQIVDAFAYAHAHGIIHRDIKPGNIFVSKDGEIKILDFGIAQIISGACDSGIVRAGSVQFMSPEQALDKPLDIRSDIYSLGAVFYNMLTGKPPYNLSQFTPIEVKKEIVEKPLPRMNDAYPYISNEIQWVVDKATSKDPASRYADCRDLKTDIKKVENIVSRRNSQDVNPQNKSDMSGINKKRNNKILVLAIIIIFLAICAGVGYWIYSRNNVRYYADYFETINGPVGTGDKLALKDAERLYKFDYKNGKVIRVSLVNSKVEICEDADSVYSTFRPVDASYSYTNDGGIKEKIVYDSNGNELYNLTFENNGKIAKLSFETNDSTPVHSVRYDFDENSGRLRTVKYLDADGENMLYQGVYGEKYEYDGLGRLVRVTYLNADDTPMLNSFGVAVIGFDHILRHHDVKSRFYNVGGKEVLPQKPADVDVKIKKSNPRRKSGINEDSDSAIHNNRKNSTNSIGNSKERLNGAMQKYAPQNMKRNNFDESENIK